MRILNHLINIHSINIFQALTGWYINGRHRELEDLLKRCRGDIACIQESEWKVAKLHKRKLATYTEIDDMSAISLFLKIEVAKIAFFL